MRVRVCPVMIGIVPAKKFAKATQVRSRMVSMDTKVVTLSTMTLMKEMEGETWL